MINVAQLGNSVIRTVNRGGGFLKKSSLAAVDLDLCRLLGDATGRSGLDGFGASDFLKPLSVLLDALDAEAELTLTGRVAMREDILQSLATRLRVRAEYQRRPHVAATGIAAPLVITGLPRSGTTFLHNLLAEDQYFRAPTGWEVMYPSPPPGDRPDSSDPRIRRAQRRMQQLYWLAPDFRVIHPLHAELPQECIAIMHYAFISDSYPTMCRVPSYQIWLDQADLLPSYQFHRRFLQQLQGGCESLHWLLKAPAHLFGLRSLLATYPDARLVFLHRDPVDVIPSLANLTLVLRRAFSDLHEPSAIGNQLLSQWTGALRKAREDVASMPDRHARCLDIRYRDLTADPIGTVVKLYRHFDIEFGKLARTRMQNYLQQRPKDQFGRHRYSPGKFGLDAAQIRQAFSGLPGVDSGFADQEVPVTDASSQQHNRRM